MTNDPNRRGRPKRGEASQKALRALLEAGIDPMTIDPLAILAAIAADTSAPASARVAACRVLMVADHKKKPGRTRPAKARERDKLSDRALEILDRKGVMQ